MLTAAVVSFGGLVAPTPHAAAGGALPGAGLQPLTPARLLDTRPATQTVDNRFVGTGAVGAGNAIDVQVTGRGGVPAGDVDAVTLNVTAVDALWGGYLTIWPCVEERPETSSLNFDAGRTVPNLVTTKVSAAGTVCIYTSAPTHLLADVGAWYGPTATDGLVELPPDRLLDTRNAIGAPKGKLGRNGTITLQVAGRSGVRDDATAVVMNVTVTEVESGGYATVWPCDAQRPEVSNLNFRPGDTVPNLVTVKLSAGGTVCVFADARTHVLADVAGFLTDELTPALVPVLQ
jgi:hypothetical protein